MSFKPTFTSTYTKGDLFYGFGVPRLALMKFLGVPTGESGLSALFMINNYMGTGDEIAGGDDKAKVAVEKYNDTAKEEFIRNYPGYADVAHLPYSKRKDFITRAETAFNIAQPDMEAVFKAALLKPHQDFWATLRAYNGGKYASALDFKRPKGSSEKAKVDAAENAAWRKKCKGGIYYGTHVLDKTVHFCLSLEVKAGDKVTGYTTMDYAAVVGKTSPTDTAATQTKDEKIRLITPAELRWVYRHREDASVRTNIQFWTHTDKDANKSSWAPCGPPWEADDTAKQLWASYKPKSTSVHAGTD